MSNRRGEWAVGFEALVEKKRKYRSRLLGAWVTTRSVCRPILDIPRP
jgi:hypothetical protein